MVKINRVINRTKTSAFVMTLLMMLYLTPLSLAYAGAGQASDAGSIPDVPENAVQYNKTDITPVCEMEQVMAGETYVFCYRNATLVMNCSRNCELNVTVDPSVKPKPKSLDDAPAADSPSGGKSKLVFLVVLSVFGIIVLLLGGYMIFRSRPAASNAGGRAVQNQVAGPVRDVHRLRPGVADD